MLDDVLEMADPARPAAAPGRVTPGPELSVVIPTFCERDNVAPLIALLEAALAGIAWEAVFVDDDSPDGTADAVRALAGTDARVRLVHRIGRRGLASAVVEGALASCAPFIAVMDADLQHDERLLPDMLARLRAGDADIVVGSRYVPGGDAEGFARTRALMSRFATLFSRLVLSDRLSDPMSGYFMLTRETFADAVRALSRDGFKILLDILTSLPRRPRIAELPYRFRARLHGESKLDSLVLWEYGMLILDKLIGHLVPVRFVLFSAVGASGVAVHFAALSGLLAAGALFEVAQALATLTAMTTNFLINNLLTYRDRRLKGFDILRGLISFYAVCSVGAVANVGIAGALFRERYEWWLAALAGIAVGTVWNYAVTALFTWRRR